MAHPKLIEDPDGMTFEYIDEEEAEFLYEVRTYITVALDKCIVAQQLFERVFYDITILLNAGQQHDDLPMI